MLKNNKSNDKYLTILSSDGTLRIVVPEGTEGAVERSYKKTDKKTNTETEVTKHELIYTEVSGIISKIKFHDGDFGKSIQLTITDEGEDPLVLSVKTDSNFGEDLMKKIPNINFDEPVRIAPYAFTDDKGKSRKGVTVYQDEEKVKDFFTSDDEDRKKLHGFPEAEFKKKTPTKDDWKLYFMKARLFLIEYIEDNFVKEEEAEESDKELIKASKKPSSTKSKKTSSDEEDEDDSEEEDW